MKRRGDAVLEREDKRTGWRCEEKGASVRTRGVGRSERARGHALGQTYRLFYMPIPHTSAQRPRTAYQRTIPQNG